MCYMSSGGIAIGLTLVLALISAALPESQAGEEPSAPDGTGPFFTPEEDADGLTAKADQKAGLPNVLLIGDSISIGYTVPVIERLKGVANVQRAKANCGDTTLGLKNLEQWLGHGKWDVIHFNWGLWDLCYRHPDAKVYGNRDKVRGTQSVPIEQYEKNLETLVQRLEKTGARLIWASTTAVPEGEAGRYAGDEVKYNAVARKVMEKHGIAIDDLHALSVRFEGRYSTRPDDVHFTKEGYAALAEQVAASIKTDGIAE